MALEGKPIAFLDVDGPLYRGFSIHDFFKLLVQRGEYPEASFALAEDALNNYRSGKTPYVAASEPYFNAIAGGLAGASVEMVGRLAEGFRPVLETKLQPYAKELITTLGRGYHVATLSATNSELVRLLERYGVQSTIATVFGNDDGKYNGLIAKRIITPREKLEALREFARANCVQPADCIAFGDSPADALMLDAVGTGFAIMPEKELSAIVPTKKWTAITDEQLVVGNVRGKLGL